MNRPISWETRYLAERFVSTAPHLALTVYRYEKPLSRRVYSHFPTIGNKDSSGHKYYDFAYSVRYRRDLPTYIGGVQFGVTHNALPGIIRSYELAKQWEKERKLKPAKKDILFVAFPDDWRNEDAYEYTTGPKQSIEKRLAFPDHTYTPRWFLYYHPGSIILADVYEKRLTPIKTVETPYVEELNPYSGLCQTFHQYHDKRRFDDIQKQRSKDDLSYLRHIHWEDWGRGVKHKIWFSIHKRDYWRKFIQPDRPGSLPVPIAKATPLEVDPTTMNYTRAKFTGEQKKMFTYKPLTDPQFFRWLTWRNHTWKNSGAGYWKGGFYYASRESKDFKSLVYYSIWYRKLKRFCASLFYDKGIVRWLCLDVREGHSFRWGPDEKPEVNTIGGTTLDSLILDHMWLSGNSYRGRNWQSYKKDFSSFLRKRAEQIKIRCEESGLYFNTLKTMAGGKAMGLNFDSHNIDKIRAGWGENRPKLGSGDTMVRLEKEK